MLHIPLTCRLEPWLGQPDNHLQIAGVTVLVDPWLEGDLIFANQTWLYRGQKGALKNVDLDLDQISSQADVILLSQVIITQICLSCWAIRSMHRAGATYAYKFLFVFMPTTCISSSCNMDPLAACHVALCVTHLLHSPKSDLTASFAS